MKILSKPTQKKIAIIGSVITLLFSISIQPLITKLLTIPISQWLFSNYYLILIYLVIAVVTMVMWLWIESNEKDEFDVLIEKIGKIDIKIAKLNEVINNLTEKIEKKRTKNC